MPTILIVLFVFSLMPIALAWVAAYYRYQQFGRCDNRHPRLQQSQLEGAGARAMGAQQNTWETLIIFSMVVFIAYASGVDLHTLSGAATLFMLFRVLYVIAYLANYSLTRSIIYTLGMCCCLYIFAVSALQYSA